MCTVGVDDRETTNQTDQFLPRLLRYDHSMESCRKIGAERNVEIAGLIEFRRFNDGLAIDLDRNRTAVGTEILASHVHEGTWS